MKHNNTAFLLNCLFGIIVGLACVATSAAVGAFIMWVTPWGMNTGASTQRWYEPEKPPLICHGAWFSFEWECK